MVIEVIIYFSNQVKKQSRYSLKKYNIWKAESEKKNQTKKQTIGNAIRQEPK